MNIGTKGRLVTALMLGVIGLNAAVLWRNVVEVETANNERRQASDIARALSEQRMLTFEYRLHRQEAVIAQWHAVSERVERHVSGAMFSDPRQNEIVTRLADRTRNAPAIFLEIVANRAELPQGESSRKSEARALSILVADQQESFKDAFRLIDIASERIDQAQDEEAITAVAGLALIAVVTILGFLLMDRNVLKPIARLQRAAGQVALGDLHFTAGLGGDDEIGKLSKDLDAMTRSLRESIARMAKDHQELAALNNELEAFGYSVSHDLQAPLRAIEGFTRILQQEHASQLSPEAQRLFERVQANARTMGRLIDDLLAFSKTGNQPMHRRPVALGELVEQCLDAMREEIVTRNVEVQVGKIPEWSVDSLLIEQVFQNLVGNALKYTRGKDPARIEIGSEVLEGETAIYVRDNGAGFDMAYANKLFGVFQRLHSAAEFEGSGVGLAIVQRIVHRHGGRIWAESKPNEGAIFWFTLGNPGTLTRP